MSDILLVDYDGKRPNLALMRLSSYHKGRGDTVSLARGNVDGHRSDKIYVSCIFRWNREKAMEFYGDMDNVVLGGTGIDICSQLPAGVEVCDPDYDLYGNDEAIGFISRGCPNNCPWCVVPAKEGDISRVSTAQDIVNGRNTAVFLDNNFLAMDGCERDLQWLAKNNIKRKPRDSVAVDFNQGLDAHRVDAYRAGLLARIRWNSGVRFALDAPGQKGAIRKVFRLLTATGMNPHRISVYVLIGFSGMESDIERLWYVHELGGRVIPMGYRDVNTGEQPRRGWGRRLYQKYKRLFFRVPFAASVWDEFQSELMEVR